MYLWSRRATVSELTAEDAKLVTLARAARSRVAADQGAAVRDETGRTYASANVVLGDVVLSAVVLAVAQAVASGAKGLEACVLSADTGYSDSDLAAIAAVTQGIPAYTISLAGDVVDSQTV